MLSLAAFTLVAAVWALFLLQKGGGLPEVGGSKYEVSALIPTGAALAPGSRVTVAGVHVGEVQTVARRGQGARILLRIDDEEVKPLPADSRVQIRQHTPVGENYVSITAGASSKKLESGATLPVTQADEFVDVDRLLSVLQGETRERARLTIRSLGGALEGRGDALNDVVGGGSRFLRDSGRLVDVLHRDRRSAARLVQQLGDVAAAVGQRDTAIGTIARRGLVALGALRDGDDALRRTIEELPESLRRIRRTSGTLASVSAVAKPVVDGAAVALRTLRPAVNRLQPASETGRAVMKELAGAAPSLRTTLKNVTALSGPLPKALPLLRKTVCEAAPILRYSKPYFPEALHILIGLGSSSNSYDATGHLIRLAPVLSENSVSGLPDNVSLAITELLYGGLIGKAGGTSVSYDAYPKPGMLGKTVATSNKPQGPEKVPETGFKYPRVEADC
jgi:virulence factor Mce-like protein